jgi:hypothetical protein
MRFFTQKIHLACFSTCEADFHAKSKSALSCRKLTGDVLVGPHATHALRLTNI